MPTAVENYVFNELPRRVVIDSSIPTGSNFTAAWLLVATGVGSQVIPVDPSTLGFEPEVIAPGVDPEIKFWNGNKDWVEISATAIGAIPATEKGQALGVATLDADGYVQLSQMNPAVIERVVVVADETARYALTTSSVQNGDVVNQQSPLPATMWYVVDDTNLNNSAGYLPFSAGVAASVAWSGITGKPAIIGDIEGIDLADEGDVIRYVAGQWINVAVADLKSSLAITISDVDLLQDELDLKQDQSTVLDKLSAISTIGVVVRTSDGAFTGREVIGVNGIVVTEGNGNSDNISLSLDEVGVAGTYGGDDTFPTYEVDAYGRIVNTTTKSLVKDTLTLLDQVADQPLIPNTTYQIGAYVETLNLLVPDPVVGGTYIVFEVPLILNTPVGNINISFPTGKELYGFIPSLALKATLNPLPGDRITLTYIANTSQWVLYKTHGMYLRELYLVGDSTANPVLSPDSHHSVASKATTARTLTIPDKDVDLSKASQAASSSEDGYLASTDWETFNNKQDALADVITAGVYGSATQYPIITYNSKGIATSVTLQTIDAGVDVVRVASGTVTLEASKSYLILATNTFTLNVAALSAGYSVEIRSLRASNTSSLNITLTGTTCTNEYGNALSTLAMYPASVVYLRVSGSNVVAKRANITTAADFALRQTGSATNRVEYNLNALAGLVTHTYPNANIDFSNIAQAASTSTTGYLTSADWNTFNGKQAALVSGTNIKTVNGSSLLGSGDLTTPVLQIRRSGAINLPEGSNTVVSIGNASGSTFTFNFTQAGLANPNSVTYLKILGSGISAPSTVTFNLNYSGFPADSNRNVLFIRDDYMLTPVTITGASGTNIALGSLTLGRNETLEITVAGGGSTNDSITFHMATNSQARISDSSTRVYRQNTQFSFGWNLAALTGNVTHTYPNTNINFGDLPSIATTNTNTLSVGHVRCQILGGSSNNVSGTDNTAIAASSTTLSGTGNVAIGGTSNNSNGKNGTLLRGRKAIAYTDFEEVDATYFGTAHTSSVRAFYDRFSPSTRVYRTYIFGDIADVSVQNGYSLSFKPKACIGLTGSERAAAIHKINITVLRQGGADGAAHMEVTLVCLWNGSAYSIVSRNDSVVVGTAGLMAAFTFSIDGGGFLIIQKVAQSSDFAYYLHGTAYHTATQ